MKRIFPLLLGHCYFIFWFFSKKVMPILTFNMLFCTDTTYNRSNFWHIFLLRRCFAESKMHRAKWNPRSYIGWAEKRKFLCIVHPTIRAINTKNMEKAKKLEQKMFHVKHFLPIIEKRWGGVSSPHLPWLMLITLIIKRCVTIGYTTHRTRSRWIADSLCSNSLCKFPPTKK